MFQLVQSVEAHRAQQDNGHGTLPTVERSYSLTADPVLHVPALLTQNAGSWPIHAKAYRYVVMFAHKYPEIVHRMSTYQEKRAEGRVRA